MLLFRKLSRVGFADNGLKMVSLMLLFVFLFDGIVTYTIPILLTQHGLSLTQMGLVYSFSSIAGAIFDFVLSRYLTKVNFRRLFMGMFVVCVLYVATLYGASTVLVYLIAMGLWGIYFDFLGFGIFDFIGRYTAKTQHAQSFGTVEIFKSIGLLLSPIIAGILVIEVVDYKPFVMALVFLSIAFLLFIVFAQKAKDVVKYSYPATHKKGFIHEIFLWVKLGKVILPVVIFAIFLSFFDAFFWTLGPLISEGFKTVGPFGGLFLTAYLLPSMFMGLFVGNFTHRFGKKHSSFVAMLIGSVVLCFLGFVQSELLAVAIVFIVSTLTAIAWPAIRAAFADYVSESPGLEPEVDGLGDLSSNIGYVLGPAVAGFIAERIGTLQSFSFLGVSGLVLSLILLKTTPKHIRVPKSL